MNNSKLTMEQATLGNGSEVDRTPELEKHRASLTKIIEALNNVAQSRDWHVLKKELFDGLESAIERTLRQEVERKELNPTEIHRLQGQLIWARKYSNFEKLADFFKKQLQGVNQQLHGKE